MLRVDPPSSLFGPPESALTSPLLVDDVDEHAAFLVYRGGLHDGSERVRGSPTATDDLTVVSVCDAQLQHYGAVILLELLDRHLVGVVNKTLSQVLEQLSHDLGGHPSSPAPAGAHVDHEIAGTGAKHEASG